MEVDWKLKSLFSVSSSFFTASFSCSTNFFSLSFSRNNHGWLGCSTSVSSPLALSPCMTLISWFSGSFVSFNFVLFLDICLICLCRFERYLYDYLVKNNKAETAYIFKREANICFDPTQPPGNNSVLGLLLLYLILSVECSFTDLLCYLSFYIYIKMGSFFSLWLAQNCHVNL